MKGIYWIIVILMTTLLIADVPVRIYDPWSQVEYMSKIDYQEGISIDMLAHIPRYIVVLPSYIASWIFNIDISYSYTIYIYICIAMISSAWQEIMRLTNADFKSYWWLTSIPFIIALFVNGRFLFVLLGLAFLHRELAVKKYTSKYSIHKIALGMLLCSVSSGTFMVGACLAAPTFFKSNKKLHKDELDNKSVLKVNKIAAKIIQIILVGSSLTLTWVFIRKNLLYFGGIKFDAIWAMASHGLGAVFHSGYGRNCTPTNLIDTCRIASFANTDNLLLGIFIVLGTLSLLIASIVFLLSLNRMGRYTFCLSIFFGVFGLTTLMTIISTIPLLRAHIVNKQLKRAICKT